MTAEEGTAMPAEECPHGDDPAICPPCSRLGLTHREAQYGPPGKPITASHRSQCPECGDVIDHGDAIRPVPVLDEGYTQWRHDYCCDEPARSRQ